MKPALLARRANRADRAKSGDATKDSEIEWRRWLLIDVDPVRPSGISATDAEKDAACNLIRTIRHELRERGWSEPVLADSGNGYHLFYRIDLPVKDDGLVQNVLAVLAKKFDTDLAKVDCSVFNPARIVKLPGTRARKGDETPDRPHRRARLLEVPAHGQPEEMPIVTREQLESTVKDFTPPPDPKSRGSKSKTNPEFNHRLKVEEWLDDRGVVFRKKTEADALGRTVYVLKTCPFNDDHGDPDSCIMQAADGMLSAHCFHNGCADLGWKDFKAKIGAPKAHHFDPPIPPKMKVRIKTKQGYTDGGPPDPAPGEPQPDDVPSQGTGEAIPQPKPTRGVIPIDESNLTVDATMQSITKTLLKTDQYYIRTDQLVRIIGDSIHPVLQAKELIGSVNALAEVVVVDAESGNNRYKPLPVSYANTWLCRPDLPAMLPVISLFTRNPVYTTDWRLAAEGYDPVSGIYCACPPIEACTGTEHLDALLQDFCFVTPGDRTNYIAFLLTILLMPRFIGTKPAALFHGNQPGLGKTILAQILAVVRDGRPTETVSYNPNDEEFEKRIGAVVRDGATTIIIDNAKARGSRNPRIDSPCLERSITDAILSFRLLGASAMIRAENFHLFCLTANTPELSRDLVTRSVAIRLRHEGDPTRRRFTIADPVGYAQEHRTELLGELIGMVERWHAAGRPMADVATRFNTKGWGRIIGGILAANGQPDFLANAEVIAEEVDETRREFVELITLLADNARGWWTPAQLVELAVAERLFESELNDRPPRAQSTRIGLIAGRFVEERFSLPDGRFVTFHKGGDRKGTTYSVSILVTDGEE